jgi:hypothetical protein
VLHIEAKKSATFSEALWCYNTAEPGGPGSTLKPAVALLSMYESCSQNFDEAICPYTLICCLCDKRIRRPGPDGVEGPTNVTGTLATSAVYLRTRPKEMESSPSEREIQMELW